MMPLTSPKGIEYNVLRIKFGVRIFQYVISNVDDSGTSQQIEIDREIIQDDSADYKNDGKQYSQQNIEAPINSIVFDFLHQNEDIEFVYYPMLSRHQSC